MAKELIVLRSQASTFGGGAPMARHDGRETGNNYRNDDKDETEGTA